jgi:hypothetical protein
VADETLNPLGKWFKLCRSCDCGSEKPFLHWVKDGEGKPLFKVCPKCQERKMKKYESDMQGDGREPDVRPPDTRV